MGFLDKLTGKGRVKITPQQKSVPKSSEYELWLLDSMTNLSETMQEFWDLHGVIGPKVFTRPGQPLLEEDHRRLENVAWRLDGLVNAARHYQPPRESEALLWDGFSHEWYVEALNLLCREFTKMLGAISAGDVVASAEPQINIGKLQLALDDTFAQLARRIFDILTPSQQNEARKNPAIRLYVE